MGDLYLLLFMTIFLAVYVSADRDSEECPQKCYCLEQYADCSRKNLVTVPKIPKWVEKLDLNHNRLNENDLQVVNSFINLRVLKLNNNSLHSIPNLSKLKNIQEVILNRNYIRSIETGKFSYNSSVKMLHINMNKIEVIEKGAFDNLTNLYDLKLNKNMLKTLPIHLFRSQTQLNVLELNHNKLRVINALVFKGLENLTTLKMKFNDIDNIMDGAFVGFKSVNHLQLDYNRISNISKGWMYGLESLQILSMSNNVISFIDSESWELCVNLKDLDLSHNHITGIESKTFQHLISLQTLNLSYNKISIISQDAFGHIMQLKTLNLNNNRISWTVEDMTGPFSKLSNLVEFNLAANNIKSVNSRAFDGLSDVVELDLRGNNITSIQQHSFEAMLKLRIVHLDSSSLLCDCNLFWIIKWFKEKAESKHVTATCAYPAEVRGSLITKLKEDNCGDSPKPRIVEHPKKQLAIKGRSAKLICAATSNPFSNMSFVWRKNNGDVQYPKVSENVTVTDTGQSRAVSVLIIPNVTHSDGGKYQCVVSNNFGTTYSNRVKVDIVTFPRFTKSPTNITVKTGETVTLNCAATGDPTPEISWKKDGGNDFPAARERRMNVMPTDHLFFIINAKTTDMGVYSCAARNLAGTIFSNATLTVLEPPSFVRVLENKEVTSGDSVVLQCMISGSPKPELKWLKDTAALIQSERIYFAAEDQILIILNAEASDAGQYECVISNDLGTKKDMIELRVLPPVAIKVNERDMTGVIIITVVCCAVLTSIVWVVIIYHTRKRMARAVPPFPTETMKMTQIVHSDSDSPQMFSDNVSEHSSCKDSGTGDSAKQTSFDGVPSDRSDQVHFETVCNYSPVPEACKLLPTSKLTSFQPSTQVCVNTSVTPATYSFSSHSGNK